MSRADQQQELGLARGLGVEKMPAAVGVFARVVVRCTFADDADGGQYERRTVNHHAPGRASQQVKPHRPKPYNKYVCED